MEFNKEKIKALSKMNVCAEQANLGEILLFILDCLKDYDGTTNATMERIEETDATTIKQLVADYNKLIKSLRQSGLME